MQSVITSKFRTTIPKEVRERLNLSVYDTLEWKIYQGKILLAMGAELRIIAHFHDTDVVIDQFTDLQKSNTTRRKAIA